MSRNIVQFGTRQCFQNPKPTDGKRLPDTPIMQDGNMCIVNSLRLAGLWPTQLALGQDLALYSNSLSCTLPQEEPELIQSGTTNAGDIHLHVRQIRTYIRIIAHHIKYW